MKASISVVLPAYNEAQSLPGAIEELDRILQTSGFVCELVVVDDGSTDGTREVLAELRCTNPRLRTVRLRRNFGKSIALQAGIDASTGDVVVLMDSDGQHDPNEIPPLIEALDDGIDLITGRRVTRQTSVGRWFASRVFNAATARVTGVPLRDFNSGMKVMRRSVADSLNLYGELHRYIPVMAHWAGFRLAERPMQHRPRKHGASKFGRARLWRGFLDLLTIQLLTKFTVRPLHLFGGIGMLLGTAGAALLTWMLVVSLTGNPVGDRPALLAGILLFVVAVQMFSIGLLAEFIASARGKVDLTHIIEFER